MVPKKYKSQESGYDYFQSKKCNPIQMNVTHTKTKIACHNVTKQNCVTKWKIENGEKVWSGNKDCYPVTWEECHEEPYEADFIKDTVECYNSTRIPYCNSCKAVKRDIMTTNYVCEAKSSLKCKTHTTKRCVKVKWQDIHQEVADNCVSDMAWIPFQEKSHEKRCLLDPGIDDRVVLAPPIGPTPTKRPVYNPPSTTQPTPIYHSKRSHASRGYGYGK